MTFNPGNNTFLPPSPVVPQQLIITAITNSFPCQITVQSLLLSTYIPDQLIRLDIPFDYGMFQADALTVKIISVIGLVFTVELDSTGFDPFVLPSGGFMTPRPASLSPAGSRNIYNTTVVPFRSFSNAGN